MDTDKTSETVEHKKPQEPERSPLRSFFDFFRKRPEATAPEKADTPKSPEAKEPKPEKRGFGERLLKLLRVKPEQTPESESKKTAAPEQSPAKPETVEQKSYTERVLGSARRMGQAALNLLTGTRRDVREAETARPTAEPVDTVPLDEAEGNVREALHEVDDVVTSMETPEVPDSFDAGGGDGHFAADRAAETAHRAWLEADRAIETENRRRERAEVRGLGTIAVGAGLLGVGLGVVNWLKLRAVRREQTEAKKRDKAEKAETDALRQELRENRQKIAELRQAQLQDMNRQQRQEHVYAVSDYANVQAERIREVAKTQEERLAQRAVANVVRLPERQVAPEVLSVRQEIEQVPEKKRRVMERVAEIIASGKAAVKSEGLGGAIGGAMGGVVDLFSGQRVPPTDQPAPKAQPAQPPQPQPVQTWLNGVLLILGIILLITILVAIG